MKIGDVAKITATIVDFKESQKTVKLRITGLSEDNHTPTEKYIRMKYENIQSVSDIRNQAIDDFAEAVKSLIVDLSVIRFKDIDEIAEQLKN